MYIDHKKKKKKLHDNTIQFSLWGAKTSTQLSTFQLSINNNTKMWEPLHYTDYTLHMYPNIYEHTVERRVLSIEY